ncbi:Restriction endonuclease [Microbacterium sp. 77mftsu3.1]|nr:Restriction endonuclease [Microbacterium sp. 77mftsu3.1]
MSCCALMAQRMNGGCDMQAFLSYPYGVDVSLVAMATRDANWDLVDPVTTSGLMLASIRNTIASADAVIVAGGVPGSHDSAALLVEVGIALGLGKPVLVVWEESSAPPSGLPSELRVSRLSLRNLDALRFHIGVFLADVVAGSRTPRAKVPTRATQGDLNRLATQLDRLQARPSITETDFVRWIEDLFRAVGSKAVPSPRPNDRGFDLVVSAPPSSELDGPVLVEARTHWPPGDQLRRVTDRLANAVASERAGLGIVVVLSKPAKPGGAWLGPPSSSVSIFSANELLEGISSMGHLPGLLPTGSPPEPDE